MHEYAHGGKKMERRKIKVAICGYGNLGKGIEKEIAKSEDMELVCIFTRRYPCELKTATDVEVVSIDNASNWVDKIDVVIMCGGSATDLPKQVPVFAKYFNTVDSFDTHAKIPEFYEAVNESATSARKTSLISGGWDPGLFSLMRVLFDAILRDGENYTFWGTGVSQGHSDAIRRVKGVKDAKQYTVPIEKAMARVRNGEMPNLTTAEKHLRLCYVVPEESADLEQIEQDIKTMPNYFADYNTKIQFISEDELKKNHSKMPHGGFVIRSGKTGDGNKQNCEFSLNLESNPEFTSSVLIALARATFRLNEAGMVGAKTILDIPPAYMSPRSAEELRKDFL